MKPRSAGRRFSVSPSRLNHLARVCALAAQGKIAALGVALRRALRSGAEPAELSEALLQTYLFAGFPRAIQALSELERAAGRRHAVRRERPRPASTWRRRGTRLCRAVYGPSYAPLIRRLRRLHPDLAEWVLVEGYGRTLGRPFFSLRVREMLALPTLAALGAWLQVESHARGARLVGVTLGELRRLLAAQRGALPPRARARAASIVTKVFENYS
ncbi:MAG: carboxymuconolactone decarboxylase family protein [Planctomycetes bacterium]|nr:carboxymuconolactone decarboxylase family protein [Planctomycetota bacterium]